jgi:hypothetical protein
LQRDLDLIRAILLRLEQDIGLHSKLYQFSFGPDQKIVVEGHPHEEVYGHLVMLLESPYV